MDISQFDDALISKALTILSEKKITINVDYSPGTTDKDSIKAAKKFKVKLVPAEGSDPSADLTGEPKDIIKYLESDFYGLEKEDIEDFFPELFK
jgi:hypothetical protein